MTILGIESSCDETSAGIVRDGRILLSNVIVSQIDIHKEYGGVVPEVAARSHLEAIMPVINKSLSDAHLGWDNIDGICVTNGPGLGGSLLIGVLTARALAEIHNKPLVGAHHVLGHIYANWLGESEPEFPVLAMVVSGGHSHMYFMRDHFDVDLIGQKIDDAVGEAFDKVAKLIGLEYPGGPSIAKAALNGDPSYMKLPQPKTEGKYDFSFSGLKTAVLRETQKALGVDINYPSKKIPELVDDVLQANIAASFQASAINYLVSKFEHAYREYNPKTVIIGGGVACNNELRRVLSERIPTEIEYAPPSLCTDNGGMMACIGCYKFQSGAESEIDTLRVNTGLKILE